LTQNPLTVVNKFLDQTAFRYNSTSEPNGGFSNTSNGQFTITHSWATIIIALEGCPAGSNPIGVETCLHAETLPKIGSTNNCSPAARPQPAVMDAAANVAANTQGTHFESEQGSVFAQAAQAVGSGAAALGGAIQEGMREGADAVAESLAHGLRNVGRNFVIGGTGAAINYIGRRAAPGGIPGVNNQYRLT